MSLLEVEYQQHAQVSIQRALSQDRVSHAYIFHGPEGVGKEALARGFAQVLLCSSARECQPAPDTHIGLDTLRAGCGTCEDCQTVKALTHPDLHLVYRQLNRSHPNPAVRSRKGLEIGVDILRHFVIDTIGLTPSRGNAKIFIIREADRITTAAQNALLKTLEEPPGASVIILLVGALERLLPTTLSRCQLVRFDALPRDFVRRKLTELRPDLPSEQADWYARCADGSLGQAVERADDGWYDLNQRVVQNLVALGKTRSTDAAQLWTDESKALGGLYRKRDADITDTEAARRGFKAIFQLAATWYADILRHRSGEPTAIVNADSVAQVDTAAQAVPPARAVEAISRIVSAERQLDLNANAQLCVETLLAALARLTHPRSAPAA